MDILVIEKDINYCNKIIKILKDKLNFKCYVVSYHYKEIEHLIKKFNFSVILIDYELLNLFNNMLKEYKNLILVMYANNTKSMNKSDYFYINKNASDKEILDILKKILINNVNSNNLILEIKNELKYLGYNPKYYGTQYLLEAIYILLNDGFYNDKDNLEKYVYPSIAKKYNKSANTVKCNIINATDIMVCECEESKLKEYLGYYDFSKPGPKKVIESIISKITNNTIFTNISNF